MLKKSFLTFPNRRHRRKAPNSPKISPKFTPSKYTGQIKKMIFTLYHVAISKFKTKLIFHFPFYSRTLFTQLSFINHLNSIISFTFKMRAVYTTPFLPQLTRQARREPHKRKCDIYVKTKQFYFAYYIKYRKYFLNFLTQIDTYLQQKSFNQIIQPRSQVTFKFLTFIFNMSIPPTPTNTNKVRRALYRY